MKRPECAICRPEKCISLDKIVVKLSPRIERSVRFVNRFYDPCRFDYCMLLLIFMPVNVCMRRGPICDELLSINMNTLNRIYQNKRDNVCMRRSQNRCRQRFTGTQGKCARLVLKACADNRKCVYLGACADKQTRESVYASF